MKRLLIALCVLMFLLGCNSSKQVTSATTGKTIEQIEGVTEESTTQKDSTEEITQGIADTIIIRDTIGRTVTINNVRWIKSANGLKVTDFDTRLHITGGVASVTNTNVSEKKDINRVRLTDIIKWVAGIALLFFAIRALRR